MCIVEKKWRRGKELIDCCSLLSDGTSGMLHSEDLRRHCVHRRDLFKGELRIYSKCCVREKDERARERSLHLCRRT